MRGGWIEAALWFGLLLSVLGVSIGIHYAVYGGTPGFDAAAAWGLLTVNFGFFLAARFLPRRGGVWTEPLAGLTGMVAKLFVNTFTIFLFIGLQAVRADVFVSLFFGGYLPLLAGSVLLLNRRQPTSGV